MFHYYYLNTYIYFLLLKSLVTFINPRIKIESSENYLKQIKYGHDLILICTILSGSPEPSLHWRRADGKSLPARSGTEKITNGKVLEIFNFKYEDEGQYECIGRNVYSISRDTIYIKINENATTTDETKKKATHLGLQLRADQVSYKVGDTFNLTCEIQNREAALNRSLEFAWRLEGLLVSAYNFKNVIPNQDTLMIFDSQFELQGNWACGVTDVDEKTSYESNSTLIEIDETNLEVELNANSTSLFENEATSLECTMFSTYYDNYPSKPGEISFVWEKVDGVLPGQNKINTNGPSKSTLQLFNLKQSDSGVYSCQARGKKNVTSNKAFLTLAVNPRLSMTLAPEPISLSPVLQQRPRVKIESFDKGKNYFRKDETAFIYCDVTGVPKPVIEWKRSDGKAFGAKEKVESRDDYSLLELVDLQLGEGGVYVCEGRSTLGVSKESIDVVVLSDEDYFKQEEAKIMSLSAFRQTRSMN